MMAVHQFKENAMQDFLTSIVSFGDLFLVLRASPGAPMDYTCADNTPLTSGCRRCLQPTGT